MAGDREHDLPPSPTGPALRVIMRRLRAIMSEAGDGQERLNAIVHQVAGLMVAEVCSIYIRRQDGSLELFATEGLSPDAVHSTHLSRGEGLVGLIAETSTPLSLPEAQSHPAFSFRPETGEEIYHSFLGVPIVRAGSILGVLTVQNRTPKQYSEDESEALQTTAMVLAEHLVTGDVEGLDSNEDYSRTHSHVIGGQSISEGIALGSVVLHQPRIAVTRLLADDPGAESERLTRSIEELRKTLNKLFEQGELARAGEHRDVLEAYRMFANDRGWMRRLRNAIDAGMSAEAAVDRVRFDMRQRMLKQSDPFWRERLRDLDDLSDRLLRLLVGKPATAAAEELPEDATLVARTMGPAELLDYDRKRLRALVIEEGGAQSHVAIVARALGIAAIGQAHGAVERVNVGDPVIVDAETGEFHVRPSQNVIDAYADKVRFRARRQQQYKELRDQPAVTRDGERISLQLNAGLLVDLQHLDEAGADGIGLFRTELQFMIAAAFPRLDEQTGTYRAILDAAADKPVVFRTLDVGGDKVLPYLRQHHEENPALGWRAMRMALDRPGLFRIQIRALLRAAAGRRLRILLPMISTLEEVEAARALIDRERAFLIARGRKAPERLEIGAMIEVPALLFDLDRLFSAVDFASVGSNDLMQFLFAADRTNERVADRFDVLSPPALRALAEIAAAGRRNNTPVTVCGEMSGQPLEALALIALGFRSISMAPASIGPVKAMVLSLDAGAAQKKLAALLQENRDIRSELREFAKMTGAIGP